MTLIHQDQDTLLTPNDPAPVEVYNQDALDTSPILIVCDHASNAIPEKLNNLGLDTKELNRHIAIDIGSHMLGRYIADGLSSTAVQAGFSRLVIDLNRDPMCNDAMPEVSDSTLILGNKDLTLEARKLRVDEIYMPYHETISNSLNRIKKAGHTPFLISVHSFTDVYGSEIRNTDIGMLWNQNKDITMHFVDVLKVQNPDLTIDDNKPYALTEEPDLNHTLSKHGFDTTGGGLFIEVRQDLLSSEKGIRAYADILLKAFNTLMEERIAKTL